MHLWQKYIFILSNFFGQPGPVGGSGGGAIEIYCAQQINAGSILANGAVGGSFNTPACSGAGGGSGGSIAIVASVAVHEAASILEAVGGAGGVVSSVNSNAASAGGQGGDGRIRLFATQRTDGQPRRCVPAAALI